MFGLGIPELLLIVVVVALVLGSARHAQPAPVLGVGVRPTAAAAAGVHGAWPDPRYVQGVRAGSLAELFGIGPDGIRWPQVLVVSIGTWLSATGGTLPVGRTLEMPFAVLSFGWPVAFVAAAIIGIRSFQSALGVALCTGVLYSLLVTGVRYGTGQSWPPEYWIRSAGLSVVWPAVTMLALQFAMLGGWRWIRMALALMVAGMIERALAMLVYGAWGAQQSVDALVAESARLAVGTLLWTMSFWFGLAKFGRK